MVDRALPRALLSIVVLLLLAGPSCALCVMAACSDCAAREEPETAMGHSEGMPCHGAAAADDGPGVSAAAADECCAAMANAAVRDQAVATPAVDGPSDLPAALVALEAPPPRRVTLDAPLDSLPPRASPPLFTLHSSLLL